MTALASTAPRGGFHLLVDTRIGAIGMAWRQGRLLRTMLPAADRNKTRSALLRALAPCACRDEIDTAVAEAPVRDVADRLVRYAEGEPVDFRDVPVDLSGLPDFDAAILRATFALGHGEVSTYGEIAQAAGFAGKAREAGQALGRNPIPLVVPCHRILAAGRRLGGFSAPGGGATKLRLLALEGVRLGSSHQPGQAAFAF